MNASGMMNLHQSITQILLAYLVNHQIGSDVIFDEGAALSDLYERLAEV